MGRARRAGWDALRRAGMRYAVLTARHHDGYALFDSRVSDFTSVKTGPRRDFVAEFVDACRRRGVRVGIYFSIMSWQFPAVLVGPDADPAGWEAMVVQTHEQLRELMSNYGPVDMLWYDGCVTPGVGDPLVHQKTWRTPELNAMVRSLQPGILINDRAALPEDFATPEQHVAPPPQGRRWEACMTINESWGYNRDDHSFKSVEELHRHLVRCASNGGNFLLNVGPTHDGSVQPEVVERLERLGDWLAVNGEAVYGTERTPFSEVAHVLGPASTKPGRAFFFLFDPKPEAVVAGIDVHTMTADILGAEAAEVSVEPMQDGVSRVKGLDFLDSAVKGGTPAVLRLRLDGKGVNDSPARIPGGDTEPAQLASNAPILGVVTGLFEPSHAPILSAARLVERMKNKELMDASEWCPGWTGWQAIPSVGGIPLILELDVPVDGCYDFPFRCGMDAGGVSYARIVVTSPVERDVGIVLGCDWWANVLVNGVLARSGRDPAGFAEEGAWFSGWKPLSATIHLRRGENELLVKCHMGSTMHWFTCRINDPGDLRFEV